eukprot:1159388-Pelagomonas_calceolata.AAC.30
MGSIDSPTQTQEDCVESDLSTFKLARSDQDSIKAAGGASSLIRNARVRKVGRYNTIRGLFSDMQVMLSQTVCAAYIHMYGKRKEKSMLAKRLCALRKGSLTSKLARISPKGPQT